MNCPDCNGEKEVKIFPKLVNGKIICTLPCDRCNQTGTVPDIPEDMRFVVENLYAKHSIKYDDLESYCYGISAWVNLTCLDWNTTVEWFELFGIPMVPVIYRGVWDEKKIRSITLDYEKQEGYVVRLTDSFHYRNFSRSIAKFVRKGHVTSNEHWFHGSANEINKLFGQ